MKTLVMFNASHFTSYEDAKNCQAIYKTPSEITALSVDGFTTEGIFDTLEIVQTFESMLGIRGEIAAGIEVDGVFYTLESLLQDDGKLIEFPSLTEQGAVLNEH